MKHLFVPYKLALALKENIKIAKSMIEQIIKDKKFIEADWTNDENARRSLIDLELSSNEK